MSIVQDELMERAQARVDDYHHYQDIGLIARNGEFFPGGVHYPPITMYGEMNEDQMFEGYTMPEDGLLDLYLHIPFCEQRCVFCHYPLKLGNRVAEKDRYLAAMDKEMDLYMRRLGIDKIRTRSILVGGGTPTFLTLDQQRRFLESVDRHVDRSACKQYNFDVEPGSLVGPEGTERLRIMRSFGVDRLTIGIQSLDEEIIKAMNRPHDRKVALESIENCLREGFQVNIEFIFGYPGETLENWKDTVREATSLGVHEIQLYRLKVEAYGDHQGPIKKFRELSLADCPPTEITFMMKQLAIDILGEAGYHENVLRRVYSKSKDLFSHYAHNQCCVLLDEIGIGLTAFSSLRDRFVLNTQKFEEYYANIEAGKLPLNRGIIRSPEEQIRWSIILPLKNKDIRKSLFKRRTNGRLLDEVFRPKIAALKEHGLIWEDEKTMALTTLGKFFADEVVECFSAPQYIPFPRSEYAEGPLNPYLHCDPFAN